MTATPLFRLAYTRPVLAGLAVGMVLLLAERALSAPLTESAQSFEKEAKTCISAITHQERRNGLPHGLLQAISLAESGRWFEDTGRDKGAIIAWPWTVTTGGQGHYLPNRIDAVAYVKSLQADGVQNIDVGCMQINLKYHPDAFSSIEQAFDATANAAYAAEFLKTRFAVSKSWIEAAGDYHSTTPALNQSYRAKVAKLWNQTSTPGYGRDMMTASATPSDDTGIGTDSSTSEAVAQATIVQPDPLSTQRFNKTFKIRQQGLGMRAGQEIANRVRALKPGSHLMQPAGQSREDTFALRRQAQLAQWRQTKVN